METSLGSGGTQSLKREYRDDLGWRRRARIGVHGGTVDDGYEALNCGATADTAASPVRVGNSLTVIAIDRVLYGYAHEVAVGPQHANVSSLGHEFLQTKRAAYRRP